MNIKLENLGLMTFPEASERWNKERSYVIQQYVNNRHKFLEGSTARVGKGKGTQIITTAGMEHLTGITEKEANAGLWRVIVERDFSIFEDHGKDSEAEADIFMKKLAFEELAKRGHDNPTLRFNFLDDKNKNYGIRLAGNTLIYYKKVQKK